MRIEIFGYIINKGNVTVLMKMDIHRLNKRTTLQEYVPKAETPVTKSVNKAITFMICK